MEIFNRMSREVIPKPFNYQRGGGGGSGSSNASGESGGGNNGEEEEEEEGTQLPIKPPPAKLRGKSGCVRPQAGEREDWGFLDAFDMTFPWHFDDNVSDGGHYGRHFKPGADNVDKMLLQTLLNGLCPL